MLQRPRFKPHFQVEVVPQSGLFILSEPRQAVLQGRLYELIAPLVDGRPIEELCEALRGQAPPSQVFFTLRKLEDAGFLCEETEPEIARENAGFWSFQGLDPQSAAARLSSRSVEVDAWGVDPAPLKQLLTALQIRQSDAADLRIVVAEHYLRGELYHQNLAALKSGQPWLLAKPVGSQIWLGPLFIPGKTGCWQCLVARIYANYPVTSLWESVRGPEELPADYQVRTAATLSSAWGYIAQLAATWVAQDGSLPLLEGKLQSIDLISLKSDSHTLIRQPHCHACGHDQQRPEQPVVLSSRKKVFTDDGGHRAAQPQETITRYAHHVSPICGAVSLLERFSPLENGHSVMHVYMSGRNIARGPQSVGNLKGDLRNSSCGKGATDAQAKASALCEALERYSGMFQGDEPRQTARIAELGDAAIHPNACMLYSERQLNERSQQQDGAIYSYVPHRFDPEQPVEWSPVWSISRKAKRYLPTAYCYFDYPHPEGPDWCAGCSNGNAAGNTVEEAVLQGLFEIVERDAVGLWWYNRVQRPRIDFDSFDDPYLRSIRSFLAQHNRELWALDLTTDLGIPVFAAISRRLDAPIEEVMFGFGCHSDARLALLRCVTELNQMLVHIMDPTQQPGTYNFQDPATVQWLKTARLEDHPYLRPADLPAVDAHRYQNPTTDDLLEDISLVRERIDALGFEVLVLDQTRPEIGLPVVKVIVPGMRHFWPRFAPGRLYDVPVQLGWLPQAKTEAELNPIAMFL